MSDTNAYRKNIQDNNSPQQVSSWSYGNTSNTGLPSSRDVYKKIVEIGQTDADRGAKLAVDFLIVQNTQGSPYYNAYSKATNQAVGNLANMGINASGMTTDWFKMNTDWQKNLVYSGTTNSPTSPGKKATAQQKAAYQMWQVAKAAQDTEKRDSEWAAMQQEIYYWTKRQDLNLSDDEIIDKIEKEKKTKYPTLYAMDNSTGVGKTLLEFNTGTDYSKDNMYGVIWAARNGQSSGNVFRDNLMSAAGKGNTWQDNQEISAKMNRDKNNADYSPFSVGATADDTCLYWGVTGIDDDMLKKIESQVDWNNQTDVDMYNKASDQLATTKQAEKEKADLEEAVNTWIKRGYSEETIQKKLEKLMKKNDFATLRKMDEDIERREARDKMVQTTYAVNYRRQDIDSMIHDLVTERDNRPSAAKTMKDIVSGMGGMVTNPAGTIEQGVQGFFGAVNQIGDAIFKSQEATYTQAPEGTQPEVNQESVNAPAAPKTETTAPSYPVITDSDIEQAAEKDRKIAEAAATVENNTTPEEKVVLQNAGSSMWNTVRDFFSGAKADPAMSQTIAAQSSDTAKHTFFDTALANVDTIANYENLEFNLSNWEEQLAQYEAKWGDVSDYEKEFHKEFSKIVENNVEVFLTYDDEKKRYVVSNIVSPERGITSMDEDILPHSYDTNSEAYRLMNVAEQTALQATEDANKVLAAQDRVKAGGKQAEQEIKNYINLGGQINQAKERLKTDEASYKKAKSAFEDSYTSLGSVAAALDWLGDGKDNGINEMLAMTEFFSNYSKQPQLPMSGETSLQRVNRLYMGEATEDQKAAYIKQEIAEIDHEIEKLNFGLEWAEKNGYQLPDSYKKNIQYKLEDLAVQRKEAEYCQILTDTDPKELEAAIKAGKAFEEKYGEFGNEAMRTWDELFGQDKTTEFYHTLREKTAYKWDEGSEWTDDEGETHRLDTITDDDENLYYYLLGKKVLELGDDFDKLWNNDSGVVDPKTEEVLTEIMKDGNDFIDFMTNDDYGIWTSRNMDRTQQNAENLVNSGFLGGVAANVASTLMTPIESAESALYLLDRALGDKRINPDTAWRKVSGFKESTRAATTKSIKDTFGEGTIGEKLASLGYEIYSNRGDSMMNSLVFGPLFGFSGKFGDMLNEFAGASPMGATAALNAAAHAVENGASTEQAWLIAGATFLSETITEAITYSNIREAFGTTKELTQDSIKSFFKDWLTKNGVEEAFGESLNDIVENAAQVWAQDLYDNGTYKAELTALVDKYLTEGMTNDEATIAAIREQAQGVLHTALVSYLSAGADVFIKAGKSALNTANNYRTATRGLQQAGYNVSTLDLMLSDWRKAKNGEQVTTEETVDEGEAPVVEAEEATKKEAPTADQKEVATDVVNIQRSKGSDASTQSAAMASALNTSTKRNKVDHKADAAAAYATRVFGEKGSTIVQETLAGAAEAKVDVKAVKQAIKNAALGDGAATALVQSEAFQKAKPADKARMLVQTLQQDSFDQKVQSTINSRVQDFRKTRTISDLAANGHFDQAQADRAAAEKAAQNTQRVEQELDTQRGVQQAAADAVQQAKDMLLENAKDPQGVNAVTQAANKADKQATVVHEYEQSAAKARQDQQAAEEKANQSAADAMATAREAGDQQIAQEDQAEVEAEAQEQAAQQAAEEEQARLQAEEDERTGKAQEDRENDIIDQIVANEGLEGQEAENRKNEMRDQLDKVKIKLRNLSQPVSKAESMLALGALERKLGIKINLEDMGEVTKAGWTRGKYSNGVITLNKNMSLGQALVEAALHEITHNMRDTNSYKAYRDVVMKSVFSKAGEIGDTASMYDNNAGFRARVDVTIAERLAAGDKYFVGKSHDEQVAAAEDEIVADFARLNLAEKDVVERFMDAGMGGKMRNLLHNINQLLKNYFSNMTGEERQQAEYFRKAERAFQKAMDEAARMDTHPASEQFSVVQMAQATGMYYQQDVVNLANGEVIYPGLYSSNPVQVVDGENVRANDSVKIETITPQMMEKTPVGMLIEMGLSDELQTNADGTPQVDENGKQMTQKEAARKMFADLMTLCNKYQDHNLIWEIAGSEFAEGFSALKSNSDPQYKTTVDFGTICSKTQAIVDVISGTMLERIKSVREWNEAHPDDQKVFTGLTREDIMMVYDKTHNANLSVPCPVCYVFSRWMGVPSLLGQMNRFQHEFVETMKDENGKTIYDENGNAVINWDATQEKVTKYLFGDEETQGIIEKYGGKEAIAEKKTSLNNKIKGRVENLPKLYEARAALERDMKQMQDEITKELERTDLDKKERRKLESKLNRETKKFQKKLETNQKNIDKNIRETDEFTEELREVESYNWVTQALCVQHTEAKGKVVNDVDENGHFIVDRDFVLTPEEILFDLNRTGEFAAYKKNWKYRTTRGAGMSKAIMPYSGASLGDIINGKATRWQQDQNPFYQMSYEEAKKAFDKAKERVRQQNLVGGQRFQSTSDFRPEWGLDYVMSFLEMQALGSKVQMYTKVAEAVDFLGSIGADVNLSIMAHGNGYHEATAEEIALSQMDTDEGKELKSRMGTLDGVTYVMEFSDVTGMKYDIAKAKSKKFNNVQMILVGMNDTHIRLAMGNKDIDFIIPWHSSGNSKDILQSLVASVGEALKESDDYTDFQTDQEKSHKETVNGKEKTIDDRTENEIKLWDARVKLLSEGGKALTEEERAVLLSNPYTKELYKRFTQEGYDPDCYGVTLPTAQAEQIFPYEYWDKTSTRENADVNGQRFAEYCDAMGLVPRFSQFKREATEEDLKDPALKNRIVKLDGKNYVLDEGYWKVLIDRKMYDNNVLNEDGTVKEYGKYREQRVVDVTKARMDTDASEQLDAEQARKAQVYQLPESTTAKYGKNYSDETKEAIYNANAALEDKYPLSGSYNAYQNTNEQLSYYGEMSDADLAMLSTAGELSDSDIEQMEFQGGIPTRQERDDSVSDRDLENARQIMRDAGWEDEELDEYINDKGKWYFTQVADRVAKQNKIESMRRERGASTPNNGQPNSTRQAIEQEDIDTLVRNGALTQEEADTYHEYGQIGNYGPQIVTGRKLEGQNPAFSTAQGDAVRAFGDLDGMLNDSDEISDFAKAVVTAQNTYFPDTNADQIQRAINWIRTLKHTPKSDGFAEALQAVTADDFDYRSADGQARMVAVMGLAAARNDDMAQAALADAFMRQGTDLGRALQARKLFKLMTPEGRIETLKRMLENQRKSLGKQGENLDLKFSEWIYKAAAVAENDADFFRVQQAAAAELAQQLPASWKDRIQTIRMLSMLGNPRTHIRNIIGNMMFEPAVGLKNKMGAASEIARNKVRSALGKEEGERTKTLRFFLPKEIKDFAREVAVENRNTLTGEAKFNEAAQIKQAQAPLGQFVKLLSDLNSNALEGEDWFFLKGHFRRAFGGWMAANGYTVDQVKGDKALMEKGMQYAVEEAQKATYRDYNEIASKLNDLMRNPKTIWGKGLATAVDAALPFRKTPANILRRGLEYSPLGIAKSIYTLGSQFRNGEINANQVIDEFCSGLSGTMIAAMGFLLAGSGAVSTGLGDDEDKLKKAAGEQKYALNLNELAQAIGLPKLFGKDVSFTVDWAAPMSMPFFVGAAIREQYENQGDFDFDQALNSLISISEPLFNLSMLDGVNSLFKTSQYEDTNSITQIGVKLGMNYISSFVPSLLGAISRTFFDDTQRKTFVSSDKSQGPKGTAMYSLEQMQNKTPWGSLNIPVRNIWGEAKTSDFAERFLENFILPGYINTIEDDPILNEMGRLFDATGDAGMIPKEDPDKSVSYKNKMTGQDVKHVFTDKEWDRVKEVRGQTAFKELTQLINSKEYKNATDGEQVKMIKAIWNHADKVGKQAVLPDFPLDDTQTVETIAQDSRISSLKEQMFKSLEAESYDDYDTMVEAIRREYDDQDEADSKIRTWLRDKYSKQYKEAYRKGGAEGRVRMMEIEDFLDYTGFDFDYDKWQEAVDEKYGK